MTDWEHATFHRFVRSIESRTGVAEIVVIVGPEKMNAYVKPIGNRAGPHVLACEWVGSQLARWFGLSTLDFGIMRIEHDDEIPLGGGCHAEPGPAFVSKKEPGEPWSGMERSLESLVNPEDIMKLVIFDTWILNVDRFAPPGMDREPHYDNVFLSDGDRIAGRQRLIAMDHTHCFTNGNEITARIGAIAHVKDPHLYGLFPQFVPHLAAGRARDAIEKIRGVSTILVEGILRSIPSEWGVNREGLRALHSLLLDRAHFLADEVYYMVLPHFSMHNGELFGDGGNENGRK